MVVNFAANQPTIGRHKIVSTPLFRVTITDFKNRPLRIVPVDHNAWGIGEYNALKRCYPQIEELSHSTLRFCLDRSQQDLLPKKRPHYIPLQAWKGIKLLAKKHGRPLIETLQRMTWQGKKIPNWGELQWFAMRQVADQLGLSRVSYDSSSQSCYLGYSTGLWQKGKVLLPIPMETTNLPKGEVIIRLNDEWVQVISQTDLTGKKMGVDTTPQKLKYLYTHKPVPPSKAGV